MVTHEIWFGSGLMFSSLSQIKDEVITNEGPVVLKGSSKQKSSETLQKNEAGIKEQSAWNGEEMIGKDGHPCSVLELSRMGSTTEVNIQADTAWLDS